MRREVSLLLRELRRLDAATHDARTELLTQSGIDPVDRRVLDVLACGKGPATTRRVALAWLCPVSTIEASLSRLQDLGWVECPDAPDALQPSHALTSLGRRWLGELQRQERAIDALLVAGLPLDDLRAATQLLRAARRRIAGRQGRLVRPLAAGAPAPLGLAAGRRSNVDTCSSEALSATASAA